MFEKKVTDADKKEMEKASKKQAKQKRESKGTNGIAMIVKSIMIPLVLAGVVVCGIYIVMQQQTKNEVVKAKVVCAKEDIKANTYIAKDDIDKFFEEKEVEASILSKSVYKEIKDLPAEGFYVESDVEASQMLYPNEICKTDEVMDKYVEGTQLTSIKVNAFDNSVSGTLRHGDIVDVYAVDPATDQLVLMVEKVYVEGAYDNSGNALTPEYEAENGAGTAVVFSVKVASDEIEAMNTAISYEGIQLYLTQE